jgi:tripartite-type tricarboxylate transporter receptor subunit TctC
VQFAFSSIAGALPFTRDNHVRALATTGLTRSVVYPDQPTMDEAGLKGFEVDLWLGIFVPAGVADGVVETLNAALDTILKQDEMKTALAKVGIEPRGTRSADGAAILKSEFDKWRKVIDEAKISPN